MKTRTTITMEQSLRDKVAGVAEAEHRDFSAQINAMIEEAFVARDSYDKRVLARRVRDIREQDNSK